MLDLVYENQTGDNPPVGGWSEDFFRKIFDHALKQLNLDGEKILPPDRQVEIGLHLVKPERSQELNKQYRQKDKPTDVLSFPLNEQSLKEYGILPLGDIFICLDVAQKQAEEISIPLNQELARLTVHGLLHLLDYDHERSSSDEKKMVELQEKIVTSLPL